MANINKITVNGTTYDIEDTTARSGTGLTNDIKQALLDCFEHVAWIDEHGQDYYDALEEALYPPANLVSISCVYTQSGAVYTNTSLNDLKDDLIVTALWEDSTTSTVTDAAYTLSGTLTVGTSTITVTYGGKTTTFTVTVTEAPAVPIYHQGQTVYDGTFGTDTNVQSVLSKTGTWTLTLELDEIDSSQVSNARIFHAGDTFTFYLPGANTFRLSDSVTENNNIATLSTLNKTEPFRLVIVNDEGTQTVHYRYTNSSDVVVSDTISGKEFGASRTLMIGAYATSGTITQRFKATYNDVSIYDVALTAAQINAYLGGS